MYFFNPYPRIFLFILKREGGRWGDRDRYMDLREKYPLVASYMHPNWQLALKLGMCPDWGLKLQHFRVWKNTPTETKAIN